MQYRREWEWNEYSLVRGDVKEEVWVLWGGILGAVGSGVAQDHEDGLVRIVLLGLPEERQAVVGDQVGEVVLLVVVAVLDLERSGHFIDRDCFFLSFSLLHAYLPAVDVDGVVVEAGIADQPRPLVPALGNVAARVLIQVFSEVT